MGADREIIPLACIAPLARTHPLLTGTYMSLAAAYTLLAERNDAWNLDAPLVPLTRWLRGSLYRTFPGVKSFPPLDMANHIMVSCQTLQRQLVPRIPTVPATPAPNCVVLQKQQVTQAVPVKKKRYAERWDLQAASLYRLTEVQGPEDLP